MNIVNTYHIDGHTESAGTVITELIPPLNRSTDNNEPNTSVRTRITSMVYTSGATVHDLVLMRALAETTTTAAASASATSVVLTSASFVGDTIASGDYLVIQHGDGSYGLYLASALATLTVTINALSKAVNSGAKVWIMGSPTGNATYHSTLKSVASTREKYEDFVSGIFVSGFDDGSYSSDGKGEPAALYSANGTNAGTLGYINAAYCRE
jgi:hypothetical protein